MKGWRNKAEREELERDANMVCELFQKWEELPTHPKREQAYNNAKEWFEKKHHCDWHGWATIGERQR